MKFFSAEHQEFFSAHSLRFAYDVERLAAIYVIGLSERLIEHFSDLMDKHGLFTDDFSFPWMTGSDKRIYLLALNLYNGFVSETPFLSSPKYLLCSDPEIFPYQIEALRILCGYPVFIPNPEN